MTGAGTVDESGQPAAAALDSTRAAANEPVLSIDAIQGNIVGGFNKDHQVLLFLEIFDAAAFRGWLAMAVDEVATTSEVLAFNRLFKAVRQRRRREPPLRASWFNLAFSCAGLGKLGAATGQFKDAAFLAGLQARSALLGDPDQGPGSPGTWKIGGPGNEADVVLIFAADSTGDLEEEMRRLAPGWLEHDDRADGARVLHADRGATLPEPLTGHEHFGFADGISQPGVRGRISAEITSYLTPRRNPDDPRQGMPGQDLIWPGQFLFGYLAEDRTQDDSRLPGKDSLLDADGNPRAPDWARDGSFLVVRRLVQDVPGFRASVAQLAASMSLDPDFLATKLLGRWASGAPLRLAPVADDAQLAGDGCRNNDFLFGDRQARAASAGTGDSSLCTAARPALTADPEGRVCPLASHIRKMNPRDDSLRFAPPNLSTPPDTRTRRILRRGIPFGSPAPAAADQVERGLLFLCYQTSIVEQFEVLQGRWANCLETEDITAPEFSAGHDPVIGRDASAPAGPRRFRLRVDQPQIDRVIELPAWVRPCGGGYFFAPSIPALAMLAAGALA